MGLKINRKAEIATKIVFFSLLGILIIILAKIFIWEHFYYQNKTVETRTGEQSIITELGDPEMPVETAPSEKDLKEHKANSTTPRFLIIKEQNVKSRIISVAIEDNRFQAPDNIFDVNWYASTARPGQGKNIIMDGIVAGPTQQGAFSGLSELQKGATIAIETGNGEKYDYSIAKTSIIDRKDAAKTLPEAQKGIEGQETLTLLALTKKSLESDSLDAIIIVQANRK